MYTAGNRVFVNIDQVGEAMKHWPLALTTDAEAAISHNPRR